ncbi:MAG TPA: MltA domain-containing protein [Phycisphaerae bacterium]|nr:MltA domain-containing protein [Phycisphaerae bacterium]HRY69003.1 MltA domain-containing protein [Phycisphaerae bacterium]HSA26023.1 MltA domain-containing protein [Phycisphaerae bacterium]
MSWSRLGWYMVLSGLALSSTGCPPRQTQPILEDKKDYGASLPPGELALVKIGPEQYPDFGAGYEHRKGLEEAAVHSLEFLSRPSSRRSFPYGDITHERAVASVEAFLQTLRAAGSGEELDSRIRQRFEVYMSRGCDEKGTVLFTGYYRPIFDARLRSEGEFRYPLYRQPPDLEHNEVTQRYQRKGGGPYLSRIEIEKGGLAGQGLELCYLKDRFETYIVTVQGSGRLRMADGALLDIGYHGDNGYDYTSIGQDLVKRGLITPEQLSLQGLIQFFRQHPDKLDEAMSLNKRYVFFTPRPGGPFGSLNVPVTPFRSIATDKQVFPRACPAFLVTQLPARTQSGVICNHSYSGFAMDQDTGGAIRAAGRCDVFLGTGPEIGELAGRTLAEGKLYYIFVKQDGGLGESSAGASATAGRPSGSEAELPPSSDTH